VEKALRHLQLERPDICLLALDRAESQLTEAILQLKAADARLQVIVFSRSRDHRQLRSLMAAGADAVISKSEPPQRAFEAVECVRRGGAFLSACHTRILFESFRKNETLRRDLDGLSEREMDVLKLLSTGGTDQEISAALGIGVRTVGTHLQHIYEKLEVHNRSAAVAKYLCGAIPARGRGWKPAQPEHGGTPVPSA
jgi:DNA-binding NarL/FixJ family response regulator